MGIHIQLTIKDLAFKLSDIEFPIIYTNCIDSNQPAYRMMSDTRIRNAYLNREDVNKIDGLKEHTFHTCYPNYTIQNLMEHVLLLKQNTALIINQLDHIHPELLIRYIPEIIKITKDKNIILYIFSNSSCVINIFKLLINKKELNKEKVIINQVQSLFDNNVSVSDSYIIMETIIVLDSGEFGMIKQGEIYNTVPTLFVI